MKSRRDSQSPEKGDPNRSRDMDYPLPAYINFVPGGIEYSKTTSSVSRKQRASVDSDDDMQNNWYLLGKCSPDHLAQKALLADETLNKFACRSYIRSQLKLKNGNLDPVEKEGLLEDLDKLPYRLPSLSVLAELAFAPLTGIPAEDVKKWADNMILAFSQDCGIGNDIDMEDDSEEFLQNLFSKTDEEIIRNYETLSENVTSSTTPSNSNKSFIGGDDLIKILKDMHQNGATRSSSENICLPVRPCGYIFQHGDIAWNCRTCQYDSTCVLCDSCFQASDHKGHEVTFHKTSPGGCCDCGDLEAWKAEGCCPLHRPKSEVMPEKKGEGGEIQSGESTLAEDLEAFRVSLKGRMDGEKFVSELLPKKVAAALGVVIGAAVNAIVQAVNGSGIGADLVQWTRRWADQMRRVHDMCSVDEEYILRQNEPCASTVGESMTLSCPSNFQLHLRLHNDDVHTYDEVIAALYRPEFNLRQRQSYSIDSADWLVKSKEEARSKTQLVDSDGQVIVREYTSIQNAQDGFIKLKSKGLHCSVVSTPQLDLEKRARALLVWLTDIAAAHPAVSALVVHALVDTTEGSDEFGGVLVWNTSRMVPVWSFSDNYLSSARVTISEEEEMSQGTPGWKRRMDVFLPHLSSSFLSREEYRQLFKLGFVTINDMSSPAKGVDLDFYSSVPYELTSERFVKSPHSLWGVMPSPYIKTRKYTHPLLARETDSNSASHYLLDRLIILDTDLRKQQEPDQLARETCTHKILGLHMISGVGLVDVDGEKNGGSSMKPTAEDWHRLLSISSYRAPISPILLMLLLDPYPTKQLRANIHQLFLSILIDARLKARLAASLGAIAYRPLTTLFCAGVGTDGDTPLHFTVQIFTVGSIVRALCDQQCTQKLLSEDSTSDDEDHALGAFCLPLAHNIVRCIHTNLLGSCEDIRMLYKNTDAGNINETKDSRQKSNNVLIYQQNELPARTVLPAAPDDGFLDCRSTRHKRLSHLLRDLEYVVETPGTALRLLKSLSEEQKALSIPFSSIWCRLLRLAQGMDPQKRKISGGHVEYENLRWLEAFSLSLHFAGARDKLAESLPNATNIEKPSLDMMRDAMGNLLVALLREMKWWLYREGVLDVLPSTLVRRGTDNKMDAFQRSTLHVASASTDVGDQFSLVEDGNKTPAFSCANQIKMTESHLEVIEMALKVEQAKYRSNGSGRGPIAGDWLRVPHSPHGGDWLSFHLPLHRAFARNILSICSFDVSEEVRDAKTQSWWKIPILDYESNVVVSEDAIVDHPLCDLLRPTLRSSNCRITWSTGPDCTSEEAHNRRSRSRAISSAVAASKVIHSLCDHPLRCLAASEQIRRHLWNRNGSPAAGMALNYATTPLCRSFRDLDLTMVQLSAAGFSFGLGARRVFSLILSRFDLEGFLCDLERRNTVVPQIDNEVVDIPIEWVLPKRLQDPEHAQVLMEAFFSTLCVLVTELPSPPPLSGNDSDFMKSKIRRELLHALAVQPLTYSKAMSAASIAVSRKDEHTSSNSFHGDSASFKDTFEMVLAEISDQKKAGSRGAPTFTLKSSVSGEYDPTFFHLKGSEHQHAMDTITRLRRQQSSQGSNGTCFSIVCPPPKSHPRFLPCRLLLHLPSLDAAIRRGLMFTLTGGEWVPPSDPSISEDDFTYLSSPSFASDYSGSEGKVLKVNARRKVRLSKNKKEEFSEKTIKSSSHSFLEILQLLTLQVHSLEECAVLNRSLASLDFENKTLSSSISINSYLSRLIHVPSSLVDVWAFRCSPDGPLSSEGSGRNKASILGMLIALYEHRSDLNITKGNKSNGDDDNGGARYLVADGLKWLLRFVFTLVDGAESVGEACKSATTGVQLKKTGAGTSTLWSIDESLQCSVRGMLENLPELWPSEEKMQTDDDLQVSEKNRKARKAAQMRILERMKKQQESFAASMGEDEKVSFGESGDIDEEADLCIICRCDDNDGESNGPLGYLGHIQRSRTLQIRNQNEISSLSRGGSVSYRVVGDKGCQLRESISLDSQPVACIPMGSIVEAHESFVSPKYDVRTRRVFVKFKSQNDGKTVKGWASIQSSQGYIILRPVIDLCYTNSRWGATRPMIKQCGHAAHLKCVDTHVASIHQKSETDTPYDGRFAADIEDGEFLCPLCKQLCNVVVPSENLVVANMDSFEKEGSSTSNLMSDEDILENIRFKICEQVSTRPYTSEELRSIRQYGIYLEQSMQVFSWEPYYRRKRKINDSWNDAITNWDFEDKEMVDTHSQSDKGMGNQVSDIMRLLRQQHIAWATIGHTAASAESSQRGIGRSGFEPPTVDPWNDYGSSNRDSHTMVTEMRRTLSAAASLLVVLNDRINQQLESTEEKSRSTKACIVGFLLGNILNGEFWSSTMNEQLVLNSEWKVLTSLLASTPCHVAKDESLPAKNEARAIAAQIWSINSGQSSSKDCPPTPYCVKKVMDSNIDLKTDWGTMTPSVAMNSMVPFRPALASSFLYLPLLSWDLGTLSGAIFSTLLSTSSVSIEDFKYASSILLVGKIIQVLLTVPEFDETTSISDFEPDIDVTKESTAIYQLFKNVRSIVGLQYESYNANNEALLSLVSKGVLPFARSLILLLRASSSSLRVHDRNTDENFQKILEDEDMMYIEDGVYIAKQMNCPTPSQLMSGFEASDPMSDIGNEFDVWARLIKRWLRALKTVDTYHGSYGNHVDLNSSGDLIPKITKINHDFTSKISRKASIESENVAAPQEEVVATHDDNEHFSDEDSEGSDDSMGEDSEQDDADNMWPQFVVDNGGNGDSDVDGDGSSDEAMEHVDDMFDDINDVFVLQNVPSQSNQDDEVQCDKSTSSSYPWDGNNTEFSKEIRAKDVSYANVSTSAIIPFQSSFLGLHYPGPGPRGCPFDFTAASKIMLDRSHLGLFHCSDNTSGSGLIRLPISFVELYSLVNQVKKVGRSNGLDNEDDDGYSSGEAAICLITGTIIKSGSSRRYRRPSGRSSREPGACTMHSRKYGSGTGIFFLPQKCTVLLIHNKKSAYWMSLYVDENGEEDPNLQRGRPLYLNEERYETLSALWRSHGVPGEVAQIRSTSDRVIRDNWY